MSHYDFAQHAEQTIGIAFITKNTENKATKFDRVLTTCDFKEETFNTDAAFDFSLEIKNGGTGMLTIEVNGWAARPYPPPLVFCLGHTDAFPRDRNEVPYEPAGAAPETARKMWFHYEPTGGGTSKDRPFITWTFDGEIPGSGTMVFTPEAPGAIIALRLSGGAEGILGGVLPT